MEHGGLWKSNNNVIIVFKTAQILLQTSQIEACLKNFLLFFLLKFIILQLFTILNNNPNETIQRIYVLNLLEDLLDFHIYVNHFPILMTSIK